MIAKCIAILAICAHVYASPCNSGCSSSVLVAAETKPAPVAIVAGTRTVPSCAPTTINRNLVGKGKYPVALKNCGPTPDQQIPVTTSRITAPTQEKPAIRLPATIPAPKVISHCCTCYKTIVRPRVHQQIVTVPTLHRYIETTHKPVIENIHYEAYPVNCETGPTCGKLQFVDAGCGSAPATFQVPAVQTVPQIQAVPTCEIPRVQAVEIPRVQAVEIPRVQAVEVPTFTAANSCLQC